MRNGVGGHVPVNQKLWPGFAMLSPSYAFNSPGTEEALGKIFFLSTLTLCFCPCIPPFLLLLLACLPACRCSQARQLGHQLPQPFTDGREKALLRVATKGGALERNFLWEQEDSGDRGKVKNKRYRFCSLMGMSTARSIAAAIHVHSYAFFLCLQSFASSMRYAAQPFRVMVPFSLYECNPALSLTIPPLHLPGQQGAKCTVE